MKMDNGTRLWRWIVGMLGSVLLIIGTIFSSWVLDKIKEHDNFVQASEIRVLFSECKDANKDIRKMFHESVTEQRKEIKALHTDMTEQLSKINDHLMQLYKAKVTTTTK